MRVVLTEGELRSAIAKLAVEKANKAGFPYTWSERVDIQGLFCEGDVLAELRDGTECLVALRRMPLNDAYEPPSVPPPVIACSACGGRGEVIDDDLEGIVTGVTCRACGGSGEER